MVYSFRKLSFTHLDQITRLIDKCFILKSYDKKGFIKWKFFSPDKSMLTAFGVFLNGELISFYSNKEMPVVKEDQVYKSAVCLDMATHPDFRRQGLISALAKKTYSKIKKESYAFSFGFSNGSGINVDKNAKDYGYKIVGQFRTFRKIILPLPTKEKLTVSEIDAPSIKKLNNYSNYYQIFLSQEYLDWRFKFNPAHEYSYIKVCEKDTILGYSIIKKSKYKVGIYKVIEVSPGAFEQVFSGTIDLLQKQKVRLVTVTILPNKFWLKILNKKRFIKARRKNDYYLTVFPHKLADKSLLDKENWILMGGDLI